MNKKIAILGPGGQYNHLIFRRIKELGYHAELMPLVKKTLDKIEEYDSIIIGGGPARLENNSEELKVVKELLLNEDKPVLGICLGFQAISLAYGGKLTRTQPAFGPQKIIVKEKNELFEGIPEVFLVWESHNDTVSELPKEFKVLAYAEKGHIEAAKHIKKKIYGVLFHPEVEHSQFGLKILLNFITLA